MFNITTTTTTHGTPLSPAAAAVHCLSVRRHSREEEALMSSQYPEPIGGLYAALCGGHNCDSTSIRRPFDGLPKVIKVTER